MFWTEALAFYMPNTHLYIFLLQVVYTKRVPDSKAYKSIMTGTEIQCRDLRLTKTSGFQSELGSGLMGAPSLSKSEPVCVTPVKAKIVIHLVHIKCILVYRLATSKTQIWCMYAHNHFHQSLDICRAAVLECG